jgi:putative DNA primase/helicase
MLNDEKLAAIDEVAAKYQPPIRKINADYYTGEPSAVQDGVVLVCGSTLEPKPISWLWTYWLALGKVHVLAGPAGQGKTTIALAFAATVTAGGRWPDGSQCKPGNVLVWSGEDDAADTLLPRLLKAGADPSRVYFVSGTRTDGEVTPFDPARDLAHLLHAVDEIGGVTLLIVDPIVSAVAGDSHKNTEVRRALQPLVDLAAICGCAVLGITHFAKGGQGSDPTQRVIGSIAFGAVARVVMVAAKVRSEGDQVTRVLARSKSNIGPDDGGFEYFVEQAELSNGIEASYIAWGNAVAGTARELLTEPEDAEGESGDTNDACDLLRGELTADCWTSSKLASKALQDAGFTKKQIWSASKKLRVTRTKDGMAGGWLWRLPAEIGEGSAEGSEGSKNLNGESSESSGELESSVREVF